MLGCSVARVKNASLLSGWSKYTTYARLLCVGVQYSRLLSGWSIVG
jgi:hypothetical protein